MWAAQTVGLTGSTPSLAAQWWEIGLMDGLTAGKVYAFNQIGGGQSINQNVVNPSIAANSHCPAYGGSGPTCDVLVGFTAIPLPSTSGYMSSGYALTPNSSSEGPASFYLFGQGPYQNCAGKSPASLPTGGSSATTIDPLNYPNNDSNFFTVGQYAGGPGGSNSCTGYEWSISWALVPN